MKIESENYKCSNESKISNKNKQKQHLLMFLLHRFHLHQLKCSLSKTTHKLNNYTPCIFSHFPSLNSIGSHGVFRYSSNGLHFAYHSISTNKIIVMSRHSLLDPFTVNYEVNTLVEPFAIAINLTGTKCFVTGRGRDSYMIILNGKNIPVPDNHFLSCYRNLQNWYDIDYIESKIDKKYNEEIWYDVPDFYKLDHSLNIYIHIKYSNYNMKYYDPSLVELFENKIARRNFSNHGVVCMNNIYYFFEVLDFRTIEGMARCFVMKDLTNDGPIKIFQPFPIVDSNMGYLFGMFIECKLFEIKDGWGYFGLEWGRSTFNKMYKVNLQKIYINDTCVYKDDVVHIGYIYKKENYITECNYSVSNYDKIVMNIHKLPMYSPNIKPNHDDFRNIPTIRINVSEHDDYENTYISSIFEGTGFLEIFLRSDIDNNCSIFKSIIVPTISFIH